MAVCYTTRIPTGERSGEQSTEGSNSRSSRSASSGSRSAGYMHRIAGLDFLDRVKEGYARKLAHMWHGRFQLIDKCGDHAARLEIEVTPYQVFLVVYMSKLKVVRLFPDRPMERLRVSEADRVDFDESLLP